MSRITPERFPDVPTQLVDDFERARRQLAGIKPQLRYAYVTGRVEGMGHEQAIRYVERLNAVRRRWHTDRKGCWRCGHPVLIRTERDAAGSKRRVSLDESGRPHACPEDL